MNQNRLRAIVVSGCLAFLPLSSYAATAATGVSAQNPLGAAGPSVDDLQKYSEIFIHAKKMMDDPRTWDKIPSKVTLCVFSPEGAKGDGYDFAVSALHELPKYSKIAQNMGMDMQATMTGPLSMHVDLASVKLKRKVSTDVKFRIYSNEAIAAEDFKANQCDGVVISNLRAKEFNPFVGSLDAIGAVQSYAQLTQAIELLAKPEAAKYMVNQDYETVGIIPMGAAYIMVDDRKINTLAKAAGKKVAVLDYDKSQARMVQQIGAQPVSVDLTTISGKFNNGQVNIMAGPALIFKPFELYKGMTAQDGSIKGAIIRFPILQITGVVMMHRSRFPAGLGQLLREFVAMQTPMAYRFIDDTEKSIPAKYWMEVDADDKPEYIMMMREARIAMTGYGYYDKNMMSFLKKIRCQFNPTNYECTMKGE